MPVLAPPQARKAEGPARRVGPAPPARPTFQAKLEVGPPRDRYEQEADRVADRVARPDPGGVAAAPPPSISPLAVQRQPTEEAEEEETLQRASEAPAAEVETFEVDEEEVARSQRAAEGPAAPVAPPGVEASIAAMRAAGGRPLAPSARAAVEPALGRDLSGVRVHDGAASARAASAVRARAFTVGQDIFFGAGRYRPDSSAGRRLIAHEAVHTVQQSGGSARAQPQRLQRDGTGEIEELEDDPGRTFQASSARVGRIELPQTGARGTLHIPTLALPVISGERKGARTNEFAAGEPAPGKAAIEPGTPFTFTGRTPRGSTTARQQWLRAAATNVSPPLETALPGKVRNWEGGFQLRDPEGSGEVFRRYVRLARGGARQSSLIIPGTPGELAAHELFRLPTWDRRGDLAFYDVDHAQELQLGGLDGWANFWLLDQTANRSAGARISNELRGKIGGLLDAARNANFWRGPNAGKAPSYESLKQGDPNWRVIFAGFDTLSISWTNRNAYWSRGEIIAGQHLHHLRAMTENELLSEGLIFQAGETPQFVTIFSDQSGGFRRRMRVTPEGLVPERRNQRDFYTGFDLTGATYQPPESENSTEKLGALSGRIFTNTIMRVEPLALDIMHGPGFGFSGYVNQEVLRAAIRELRTEATGASPVTFTEAGIGPDGALFADGQITATKALFPGLVIPVRIRGNDVFIDLPIPTERLNFGPVTVTEAALALGAGESGVFLKGSASFMVDQVGEGMVTARVERGNTILSGQFDVELDFLETARAEAVYDLGADTLTIALTAGVGEGALPGVTSGEVTVTINREAVSVAGALQLAPPFEGAEVAVAYAPETGLSIAAENIPLPVERLPGVENATVSVAARRNPETGEWRVSGGGAADLAVAGATGRLVVLYDGGAITVTGVGQVERGPASGWINVTLTNRPVDEEGNPVEGEVADSFTVWGRGGVEITFGRVLRGSAEIELTPEGSIILRGTIGLPPNFEVFPRQSYERELLRLEPPEFPIWGVSIAGVGFGIFAFVDARVQFVAFIGPGELRDTEVSATMNLDEPQNATVDGSARFFVPAGAELSLDLGGGLRARVAVAFVQGRIGLEGSLGIEAEASAGVQVHWRPEEGLSVEADVEAEARPKFRLSANASVEAGVDLLLGTVSKTWGPWERTLGEFGPDLEFGITVPVRWTEQDGIDFDMEDIRIRRPDIDAAALMSSAFDEIRG